MSLHLAEKRRARAERDPAEDAAYSKQFFDIAEQGHTRPTPRLGAPCAHWRLAVWPRTDLDPNHQIDETPAALSEGEEVAENIGDARFRKLERISGAVNALIRKLKARGAIRTGSGAPESMNLRQSTLLPEGRMEFDVTSIGFTLWWEGSAKAQPAVTDGWRPSPAAIRVRVQVELHEEFFTVTFFMDIGKPWNESPVFRSPKAVERRLGETRIELMRRIEAVQAICEPSRRRDDIGVDLIPETKIGAEEGRVLLDAADRLYDGVWDDFCSAFGLSLRDFTGEHGRIFANFRGVALPTAGLEEEEEDLTEEALEKSEAPGHGAPGVDGRDWLPRFSPDGAEANATVKAYWPFIRRMSFGADYRDWIACTIFGRRSVFVTSLGSPSLLDGEEEGELSRDVPTKDSLPGPTRRAPGDDRYPATAPQSVYGDRPAPFRELYLTKWQPHPAQLGRMLERFNTLGTLRLYALKNAAVIKDAGSLVRAYGQELNAIMSLWFEKINTLQEDKKKLRHKYPEKKGAKPEYDLEFRRKKAKIEESIADRNSEAERALIDLSIRLNRLGVNSTGGLEYRINRSRRHAQLFQRFVDTMHIEEIDTWLSYREFSHFGLSGAFEEIDRVGLRVEGLRRRLLASMTSIQTGAIAGQTEATRDNTHHLEVISDELKQLEKSNRGIQIAAFVIGAALSALAFFTGVETWPELKALWDGLIALLKASGA